jgi:cholera toxin transcriptional activator
MADVPQIRRFRFGIFELDSSTGELRRRGLRVKLHAQPLQVLLMLVERPGEIVTREEICRALWPDGTFVDHEHSVNSAVNRLREALGDKAANPRFIETLARRGYRFVAPVDGLAAGEIPNPGVAAEIATGWPGQALASAEELPKSSHVVVQTLFVLLQVMYVAFYVGALTNLTEINEFLSSLPIATLVFDGMIVTAALLIPVRTFLLCGVLFHAPGIRGKFVKIWPFLMPLDALWALSPFLLHHINYGLALACTTLLVYSPFAQRSLILMGAGDAGERNPEEIGTVTRP